MAVWIPVGDGFIEADVIRWKEPVFKNRRHGRPARLGERLVTAEVLRDDGGNGWVDLLVRRSEVLSPAPGRNPCDVLLPEKDTETRRRRGTILKGDAERLEWSDESARASVAGQPRPVDPMPARPPPTSSGDPEDPGSLRWCFNAVSHPVAPTVRNLAWAGMDLEE
jgi:hypothetical protein